MRGSLGLRCVYYDRPLSPLINPHQGRAQVPRMTSPGPTKGQKSAQKMALFRHFSSKKKFFSGLFSEGFGLECPYLWGFCEGWGTTIYYVLGYSKGQKKSRGCISNTCFFFFFFF